MPSPMPCQFSAELKKPKLEPILAPKYVFGVVAFQVEQRIQEVLRIATMPEGWPATYALLQFPQEEGPDLRPTSPP